MSLQRNQRRAARKAAEKKTREFVRGLDKVKKFVFKGFEDGSITREDMVEMCQHFLGEKMCEDTAIAFLTPRVRESMSEELAIEFLVERKFTVMKVDSDENSTEA